MNNCSICTIGQDSHAFEETISKPLMLGGVFFPNQPGLRANSDGDVVLHAITNAISGATGIPVLGPIADRMCQSGITDSSAYLAVALGHLSDAHMRLTHLSLSLECLRPKIIPKMEEMKAAIAAQVGLSPEQIGITATTGEGLTPFGQGLGISVLCIASFEVPAR